MTSTGPMTILRPAAQDDLRVRDRPGVREVVLDASRALFTSCESTSDGRRSETPAVPGRRGSRRQPSGTMSRFHSFLRTVVAVSLVAFATGSVTATTLSAQISPARRGDASLPRAY